MRPTGRGCIRSGWRRGQYPGRTMKVKGSYPMDTVKKVAAIAAALFLTAAGTVVLGFAAPQAAQAAPSVTFTPKGPFKGGELITVTATGFTPGAPVAIGECRVGRPVTGPGDCGVQKERGAKLTQADATGKATAVLKVIIGPLNNTKAPVEKCGPGLATYKAGVQGTCYIGAQNITNVKEGVPQGKPVLTYVTASSSSSKSSSSSSSSKSSSSKSSSSSTSTQSSTSTSSSNASTATTSETTTSTAQTTAKPKSLPKTGPKETALLALAGLILFQIGLIFAVRATRAAPRRAAT